MKVLARLLCTKLVKTQEGGGGRAWDGYSKADQQRPHDCAAPALHSLFEHHT